MLFNSWIFVPFIAVVLPVYWLLGRRWQNRWIILASYVFYGAWDVRFLVLLAGTTLVDYGVGRALDVIEEPRRRKRVLVISLAANLGVLGFFKYFNFFAGSLEALLATVGVPISPTVLHIVLPVGVSFYTFQSMSYTIDVYRRKVRAVRSLEEFVTFVSFFPQLVAGPIERANLMVPQIQAPRRFDAGRWAEGLWLFLFGLFKKVVIADNLAGVANGVFNGEGPHTGVEWLLGLYAFAYQIYCDFSGYSDMARGLAKLLGFELMLNFELPYLARNPSDFWRRWHISLSTWLRDYLYIPLGGNRGGHWRTYRNLMITMLLGGLWHGAAWTFILWGAYHGAALAVHRWLVVDRRAAEGPAGAGNGRTGWVALLSVIGMFHVTCVGWLLFRSRDLRQVGDFWRAVFTDFHLTPTATGMLGELVLFTVPLWVIELYARNADGPWRRRPSWEWGLGPAVVTAVVLMLVLLPARTAQTFIYFQF